MVIANEEQIPELEKYVEVIRYEETEPEAGEVADE